MRHGGDKLAVLFQRRLLLLRLADERDAHRVHALRQPPDLVVAVRLHLRAEIAAPDLLNFARHIDDGVCDAAVIQQHQKSKQRAGQHDGDDLHGVIELRVGKVIHNGLKQSVAEADGIERERALLTQLLIADGAAVVDAPPAGLQRQMPVFVEQDIDILLLHRPARDLLGVARGEVVLPDVALQAFDRGHAALVNGLVTQILRIDEPVAALHRHKIGQHAQREARQHHEQELEVQRAEAFSLSQSDTPSPRRCG